MRSRHRSHSPRVLETGASKIQSAPAGGSSCGPSIVNANISMEHTHEDPLRTDPRSCNSRRLARVGRPAFRLVQPWSCGLHQELMVSSTTPGLGAHCQQGGMSGTRVPAPPARSNGAEALSDGATGEPQWLHLQSERRRRENSGRCCHRRASRTPLLRRPAGCNRRRRAPSNPPADYRVRGLSGDQAPVRARRVQRPDLYARRFPL